MHAHTDVLNVTSIHIWEFYISEMTCRISSIVGFAWEYCSPVILHGFNLMVCPITMDNDLDTSYTSSSVDVIALYCHLNSLLLTLVRMRSEGYCTWSVCVCVCVHAVAAVKRGHLSK